MEATSITQQNQDLDVLFPRRTRSGSKRRKQDNQAAQNRVQSVREVKTMCEETCLA